MAWVQSKGSQGSATTLAVTFTTANVTLGNTLVAVVSQDHNTVFAPTSVKDGAGNTFVHLGSTVNYPSSTGGISVWALNVPAGDAGTKPTITATFTSTFGNAMVVQEVSGIATSTTSAGFVDGTIGTNTGTATPATSGAYSTGSSGEFLLAAYGDPGTVSTIPTVLTGYTADTANPAANTNADVVVGYVNSSTSGSQSFSWAFTGTNDNGTYLFAFLSAGGAVKAPPPSVSKPKRARRGFIRFFKGPITPVPQPPKVVSTPVRSLVWHRKGVIKVFQGPVNPVAQPPQVVTKPHKAGRGRILFFQGPVNPVQVPHQVVSAPTKTLRFRRGRINVFKGPTPAPVVAVPNLFVSQPVKSLQRRHGVIRVFQAPVNPVPVPPQVVTKPHHRLPGRVRVFQGPVNVVPLPPLVVSAPTKTLRYRHGVIRVFQGTVPAATVAAVAPVFVSSPTKTLRYRRGRIEVLKGVTPGPTTAAVAPVYVCAPVKTLRYRHGVVRVFQGPVNAVAPAPVFVSAPVKTLRYRRGRVEVFRGPLPAVTVVPLPPIVVQATHQRRRGRILCFRGPVNPVAVPHVKIFQIYPPRRRSTLRYVKGVTLPPPPFSVGFLHSTDQIQNYLLPGEGLTYEGRYGQNNYGAGYYGTNPPLVYGEIAGTPTSFRQAVLTSGDGPNQGQPLPSSPDMPGFYGVGVYGAGVYGPADIPAIIRNYGAPTGPAAQNTLTGSSS